VTLFWLPLGADGSPLVRWSGRAYEARAARRAARPRLALVHTALAVRLDGVRHVIEVAPAWDRRVPADAVAVSGAVGSRWLGHSPLFRYDVRCWAGGRIPDEDRGESVPIATDAARAAALLDRCGAVPSYTWGRDELGAGEMWTSNSVVAWLLATTSHDPAAPPAGRRAPGWDAGLVRARLDGVRAPR
jgi:hypothetical protein